MGVRKRSLPQSGPDGKGPVHTAAIESILFANMLPFLEHLCVNQLVDGTPRTPGTAFIKTDSNLWKVVLKEPDAKLQLCVAGTTLDDTLALASLLLETDAAPWETDKWAEKQKGPVKKNS